MTVRDFQATGKVLILGNKAKQAQSQDEVDKGIQIVQTSALSWSGTGEEDRVNTLQSLAKAKATASDGGFGATGGILSSAQRSALVIPDITDLVPRKDETPVKASSAEDDDDGEGQTQPSETGHIYICFGYSR